MVGRHARTGAKLVKVQPGAAVVVHAAKNDRGNFLSDYLAHVTDHAPQHLSVGVHGFGFRQRVRQDVLENQAHFVHIHRQGRRPFLARDRWADGQLRLFVSLRVG